MPTIKTMPKTSNALFNLLLFFNLLVLIPLVFLYFNKLYFFNSLHTNLYPTLALKNSNMTQSAQLGF
ncbi:hypothetical protein D9K81_07290 [Acinetobacter chengduensis]|uniref:ATP synthase F0 subunit 8 n=1 Tax=Acinetobacter chengduensis TaxID=2420890 RepID=A0ABX9TYD5_9GAMM|nr:hypothetical protein D7V31_13750 [Acinetobacter sp. WCHAc060007]RLL22537.1 hypothetical protein D9K81_07290 [Acinetobacter chengduensis]